MAPRVAVPAKKQPTAPAPKAPAPEAAPKEPAQEPAPEPEAPAPTSKVVSSSGKFTFTMETVPEVPAHLLSGTRAASPVELPFKGWFGEMGHNAHIFLPQSFWTSPKSEGGRGVAEEDATVGYVRTKIRGAFNDWQKKDLDSRSNRTILLYPRLAGDDNGRFEEAGMSIFMQITKEPTKEPEAS